MCARKLGGRCRKPSLQQPSGYRYSLAECQCSRGSLGCCLTVKSAGKEERALGPSGIELIDQGRCICDANMSAVTLSWKL